MNHDIDALKSGDQVALKALFDDIFHRAWFYSWKITGDKYESEDIALRAFVKTWEKMNDFSVMKEMIKYLYIVVQNGSLAYIRKTKIKRKYENHILHTEKDATIDDNLDAIKKEVFLMERLYEEIEKLPPQCKAMFKLYYIDKVSRKEIAQKLNVTVDTVNNQCRNAVIKLKAAFSSPEYTNA